MQLTPSQVLALDDSKHLAIVANAGSGKTSVLVQRYVELLINHRELSPRNLVAITFTEAAAAELRTRIAKELDQRISDPANSHQLKRLIDIRNGLASAYISTIHAFALRIIKAYPVEANVDATFTTITDTDLTLVIEDAIQSVFEKLLTEAYASGDPDDPILQTFRALGRTELGNVMEKILKDRWKSHQLRENIDKLTDSQLVGQWLRRISSLLDTVLQFQLPRLELLLENGKKSKEKVALEIALPLIRTASAQADRVSHYCDAIEAAFTGKLSLRAALIPKAKVDGDIARAADDIVLLHSKIHTLADRFKLGQSAEDEEMEYARHLRTTLAIYSEVEQAFIATKVRYSALDFDDLISRLYELLQRKDVAEELSQDFAFLLMDEYQDTDAIQFEIARLLTDNFTAVTKLAIVGDPKQSIYGFRGADIRTFNKTRDAILAQFSGGSEQERGLITLAESFRMAEQPLAFVNYAFREIMLPEPDDLFGSDPTPYEELVSARTPARTGSVEFLIHEVLKPENDATVQSHEENGDSGDSEDSGDGTLDEEFLLVAARIQSIVKNRDDRYSLEATRFDPAGQVEDDKPTRVPEYRDIAILLRARTQLAKLTQALTSIGVPFNVARGVGFFDQQEVIDLVSYLTFLVRPNDDVSLLGILRSPIFAISDTEIFKLHVATKSSREESAARSQPTFWQKVQHYSILPSVDPLLKRAVAQLQENLSVTGRITTSAMLEKILHESALEATYAALPNGAQSVANMRKLVSLVRGYDSRGFTTMQDCVERLQERIYREDREAQAPTSDENAVRIMTIHGAKGLEFPIVFVVALSAKQRTSSDVLIDPELGIRYQTSERPDSMIAELLKITVAAKEKEEMKRLLYVALTRARDHLILSASLRDGKLKNKSFAGLFSDFIKDQIMNTEAESLGVVEHIQKYNSQTELTTTEVLTFSVPITRKLEFIDSENEAIAPELKEIEPEYHLERYTAARGLGRFSPTQLLSFTECATKYYLKYILGLPEDPRLQYDLEPDEHAERIEGTILGQLLHKVFERIDQLTGPAGLDHQQFERYYDTLAKNLGIRADEQQYHDQALQDVERFLQSDLAKIALTRSSKKEFLVQAALSETDLLRGILDRLIELENGDLQIVDYKTDQRSPEESPAKQARHKFQMRFYAYLISLLYPNSNKITTTLYYTHFGTTQEYLFTRADFAGIESELTGLIDQIRALEDIKRLTDIEQNIEHCKECSFFDGEQKTCRVNLSD